MASFNSKITVSNSEYRPCYVEGKKALFHRWEERKIIILKVGCIMKDVSELRKYVSRSEGVIFTDSRTNWDKQVETYGIVEYEDGTVDEVIPTKIRFVSGIMKEYCFDEKEVNRNDKG